MSSTSWVTLATNDSYSLGALVLGNSLRNVGTAHQLTVLITPGVTNSMRDRLSTVFNNVKEVNVLDSRDKANLALLARPDLGITFTKLHCWRLTEFSKAVFMDADTLVLKNCDELFEREEFSAAPDAGWPDCFNSGVFVFKPSEETYQALLQFAVTHGSFDGGDQGLLNSYFSEWSTKDISRHLPFIYNMVSSAFYSYLPALKQYGDKVKIVHFIGPCKPWLQYLDCETKKVRAPPGSEHLQPLLQLWWDIFCSRVHSSLTAEMNHRSSHAAPLSAHTDAPPARVTTDNTFPPNSSNQNSHLHETDQNSQDVSCDFVDPWETYSEPHYTQLYEYKQNREVQSFDSIDNVYTAPVFIYLKKDFSPDNDGQPAADLFHSEKDSPYTPDGTKENTSCPISYRSGSEVINCETTKKILYNEPEQSCISSTEDRSPCEHTIPACVPEVEINSDVLNKSNVACSTNMQLTTEGMDLNDNQDSDFRLHDVENNCNDVVLPFLSTKQPLQVPDFLSAEQVNAPYSDNETESIENECDCFHSGASSDKVHGLTEAGLAGALAQLTLGVPRTPEQIALDEHLRRQAWEEGRFDYMGADSFQNIWQKISETMAEKPESKDVHQEETPPVLPEQQSSIVSPEPREQISAASAAVGIGQTSTAPQTPPSTDVHTTSFPPPVTSPTTQELTVEKPVPGSEHPAVAPPPGITPALSGLASEQKVQTDPVYASKLVTQASVQGAESPAVAVLPPSTLSKSPVEAAAPALSQVEATPKESVQTLPSQILASTIAPTTIPFTSQPPSAPIQTIAQPPVPSVKPESAPTKPALTDISEQSTIVPVSAVTQLASQPLTTPAPSVPLVPSAATPPTVPGSSPPTAPPVPPPIPVSSAPPLVPQPPTTPVQPVAEHPSPISPTTAAPSVEPVGSAPLSALPAAAPSSVPVLPAAPVSSPPDHVESKMPPQPLTPAVSNVCKPSENAPVIEPFSEIAPPEVQLSEKSLEPTIVPEIISLQHTPESPISTLPSQPSVPTIEGTVPPLVPTAPIVGVKPSPPTTVSTSKTDLPSPSLPAPAPPSTEGTSESSTPLSAPTSPIDIQTRPMSTALVSVPKAKQKVPIRVPEPPKPPIPMPAPESPSALPSPPLLAGALASSETETSKTVVSVSALPKEPKTEGSTSQSPKQPEKQQETVKHGKDKGNLEELPATQLTEAESKLSKKAKNTEHGTDSQAAPEKISAKTSTKQAKQSKPKAPETPTKSETTAAKPASPPTTEPTSPEAEVAPQVTKVKTKVIKVPKGTKDPASKDVPQQDPVLKSVTPPVSSPVGSPPLSPDAGKVPPIVEKSSAGAEKGTETSEQASVAPVPPKRKGAKATASGDGSSKTQSKPTKTAPKPKK